MPITNPKAALKQVSDFRTGKDDYGEQVQYGKEIRPFRANANIARGQVVSFVMPTQKLPLSVTPAVATNTLTAGVAENTVLAGEMVTVCIEGATFVLAGGTLAAGDVLGVTGAGGKPVKITPDATTVAGSILGFAHGGGGVDTLVPAYVNKQ